MPRPSGRVSTGYSAFQTESAVPSPLTHTSPVACCGNRVDPNSSPISCMQTGLCRMRTESLAVTLTARGETDFGRQRLGCQNRHYRHLNLRQRPQARYLNRGNARKSWAIRQRPGSAGSYRTGWWAREDSNLQPDRYERSALTIELRAHSSQQKRRCATRPHTMPGRKQQSCERR